MAIGKREPDVEGGALKLYLVPRPTMGALSPIGRRRPDVVGGALKCFIDPSSPGFEDVTSKVAVDEDATPDFLGAAKTDGVLRIADDTLSYTDNGDSVELGFEHIIFVPSADCVFIGEDAGTPTPALSARNVALGNNAADSLFVFSNDNTFIGDSAGRLNTSSGNTFVGSQAGETTTGSNNVYIGVGAGGLGAGAATTNVAIGNQAGEDITSGSLNVFLGNASGRSVTTGQNNLFMGGVSGQNVTTGTNNTLLGSGTGATLTTGSGNLLIGQSVDVPAAATSDYYSLADVITGQWDAGNETIEAQFPVNMQSYTVAGLPGGVAADVAYASDGRKAGEGVGAGTGVLVFYDGTNWIAVDSGATVAA